MRSSAACRFLAVCKRVSRSKSEVQLCGLDFQGGCDFLNRNGGRHLSLSHCSFDLRQLAFEGRVRPQVSEHSLLEHRPHPLYLLLPAASLELSRFAHSVLMIENGRP